MRKKGNKNVLKNASVLLIATAMVLSTVVVAGNVINVSMSTILSEGFESGSMPPVGWSVYDYGEEGWGVTGDAHSGDYAAYWMGSVSSDLISPVLDCSAMNELYLSFWHKQPSLATFGQDTLSVYVSVDGAIWNHKVADYTGGIQIYKCEQIDLSAIAAGQSQVKIKFTATGGGSGGVYLDDIGVSDEIANNPPETPKKPIGPTTGEPDEEYTYVTSTTDPNDDMIRYGWEWTQDNTVEGWTKLYSSGATCSVKIVFDEPGTYYLRAKAEDEYGAQSGFSSALIVVISQGCGEFMGLQVCPLGDALLDIGDELRVYNCVSGQPETDGVWVNLEDTYNAYIRTLENPFETIGATINFESSGMIGEDPFSMGLQFEHKDSGRFAKALGSAVAIIAFGPDDDIEFYKEVDDVSDIGYLTDVPEDVTIQIPDAISSPSILSSKSQSLTNELITVSTGIELSESVLWTWEEHDIDQLSVNKIMIIGELEGSGKTSLSSSSITTTGIDEFTMLEHSAYQLNTPTEPNIDGPPKGKTGETYTISLTNKATENVYFFIDWGDGSALEGGPVQTIPGDQGSFHHTWSEDGTYNIKARSMNTWGIMSGWTNFEVKMPKAKSYINTPLLQFLHILFEKYPNVFPVLQMLLQRSGLNI